MLTSVYPILVKTMATVIQQRLAFSARVFEDTKEITASVSIPINDDGIASCV